MHSSEHGDLDEHRARMRARQQAQGAEVRSKTTKRGVIVLNTGDGKGKSSAAFGVAIRAAGHGQRVGVLQFIKGCWQTGEQLALARFPEIEHVLCGEGFTWDTQDRERDTACARAGWERAKQMIESGRVKILECGRRAGRAKDLADVEALEDASGGDP